jgi:hypothetical protein
MIEMKKQKLLTIMALAAIVCTPMLGGCVSDAELAAADDNDCRSYGAHPGSQAYFQCRMVKSDRHDRDRIEKERASEALIATGAALMAGGSVSTVTVY